MTMVKISDETLGDIKKNLQDLKMENSQLRIYGSIG